MSDIKTEEELKRVLGLCYRILGDERPQFSADMRVTTALLSEFRNMLQLIRMLVNYI